MKKVMMAAAAVMILGLGTVSTCNAVPRADFTLPAMSFSETLAKMQSQEFPPVEIPSPALVSVSTTELIIVGTINGDSQKCVISDNKLLCSLSGNNDWLMPENNKLMFARTLYLDSILKEWTRTSDIREACPSAIQHVCTDHHIYNCTHTIVPVTHKESRPCTTDEINAGQCPSNGMVWVTVTINECHVSCSETSTYCKQQASGI